MQPGEMVRINKWQWKIERSGKMRVSAIIFASDSLIRGIDERVIQQICNVAALPGIQRAAYAMPDAHRGYGFPIGGVAAFDPKAGGVVSAGGVGFDISCGVRSILTHLPESELKPYLPQLGDKLFRVIPAGLGSTGKVRMDKRALDNMLQSGARWAIEKGYGTSQDLERIEHRGIFPGANPSKISSQARSRQKNEMGTLGSGNHYLEVQKVAEIYDRKIAKQFQLVEGETVISIHCGSRGLGHQVAREYSKTMLNAAKQNGLELTDRELACAPISSPQGKSYLGAMAAAANCALANRQILTHLARQVVGDIVGELKMPLLYDVSHNTCNFEKHAFDGKVKSIYVHRKGATRALGPNHSALPDIFKTTGQPVLVGGTMGTASYILAGAAGNEALSFSSASHGAGRQLSRSQATKRWQGKALINELAKNHIIIRSNSYRGLAEEAPEAYKDVSEVVEATANAGLARKVARLIPLICIKG